MRFPLAESYDLSPWEAAWSPYDGDTYRFVLAQVSPADVVLDIGAGDLRLARLLAAIARRVTAVEINPLVLSQSAPHRPSNLRVVCGDARSLPFPPDTTVGVLLMRHCEHLRLYVEKLRSVGCRRLITNARRGMGLEIVDLGPALPFEQAVAGWYVCRCGALGVVAGTRPDDLATLDDLTPQEVEYCPACSPASGHFA